MVICDLAILWIHLISQAWNFVVLSQRKFSWVLKFVTVFFVFFYATAASAMRWHIAIHLCLCMCVCLFVCVCVCVLYRLYSELKISSCEKPLVQFQPNLAGLILGWRASKVVQRISFHVEIWLPWQPKGIIRINLKNLLVKIQKA
jgi:hypothetical protein